MKNNLYKKLLQLFILGYEGEIPSKKLTDLVKDGLGGIIFFAENLKCRTDFTKTVQRLKQYSEIPLFLSIDQEGGLVERTIFFDKKVEYLTPKALSHLKKNDIKTHYGILAKDLASMGLNLNFAPVVDVNSNPTNPIIGVRSFGNTPEIVNTNSKIAIDTFKENGILSCAKHYPGHGDTNCDSHKVMPYIDMNFDEFYKTHLICFKEAIKNNADSIMVSHIHFSFFDKTPTPASLSKNAINYLKNELNFKGIIFSDDMVMGGITQNYGLKESIILALKAGIDMLIFRNTTDELINAIGEISLNQDKELQNCIEKAYEKILTIKKEKIKNITTDSFDTEKSKKIITQIAQKTPQILSGKNFLPIDKNKNIKIISFNNEEIFNLSYIKTTLSNFMRSIPCEEIKYPLNPAREDIKNISEKTNNSDTIIFLSYNPSIHHGQIDLFNKIKGNKILVHCGTDDFIPEMSKAECIISLCCYKPFCLKALADILT
ncbi:MAG: hypothetical protein K6A44_02720 [bacterium]|nr:hypothetical protein [bacterium]